MSRRTPPESIAWLQHAAAAGQADARLMLTMLERIEALEQRPIAGTVELAAPTPEAVPMATDDQLRLVADAHCLWSDSRRAIYILGREHGAAAAQPAPEAAQVADDDEPQTLHTIALKMVNTLEQLGVLPEILDTLRRAIREPMQQPTPEAAQVATDAELVKTWDTSGWGVLHRMRAIYSLGREHGAAAAQPAAAEAWLRGRAVGELGS